jgi:hypothetical protein
VSGPQRTYLLTQHRLEPTPAELQSAEHALSLACSRLARTGASIRLLATGYDPEKQQWHSLCVAATEHDVLRAAGNAQLTNVDVAHVTDDELRVPDTAAPGPRQVGDAVHPDGDRIALPRGGPES